MSPGRDGAVRDRVPARRFAAFLLLILACSLLPAAAIAQSGPATVRLDGRTVFQLGPGEEGGDAASGAGRNPPSLVPALLAPRAVVSVAEALNILKSREGKEKELGVGGRSWIGEPSWADQEDYQEACERIIGRLARLKEHDLDPGPNAIEAAMSHDRCLAAKRSGRWRPA